jgi:hypothetical protein
LADAIESIDFECTRCGACCKAVETHGGDREKHIATVFPYEVRRLGNATEDTFVESYDWRDLARPLGAAVDREGPGSGATSPRARAGGATAGTPRSSRPR